MLDSNRKVEVNEALAHHDTELDSQHTLADSPTNIGRKEKSVQSSGFASQKNGIKTVILILQSLQKLMVERT